MIHRGEFGITLAKVRAGTTWLGDRTQLKARTWRRIQLALTVMWAALIYPSVTWWSESIPWLVLISAWANLAGHFSAWQAARAEEQFSLPTREQVAAAIEDVDPDVDDDYLADVTDAVLALLGQDLS